jgi:DNA polymerase I-like protein with 3'-5' exonuclease and polymerase domains
MVIDQTKQQGGNMVDKGRYGFDIESSSLLDDSTVDYTASPWKLKDGFKIHCIVAINKDTGETKHFVQDECYTQFKDWMLENVSEVIHFNGINFDMLACKAALGIDYTIGPDTWGGKPIYVDDLYVKSKTLNPDRRGHSLEYFGEILGFQKIDWRAKAVELGLIEYNAPKGAEFAVYHPEMLVYCERDVQVTLKTKDYLDAEWGDWDWEEAYELEKAVAEIITRQSHRGFWFDYDLATANLKELDILMEERRSLVEPHLPEKPMGKTKLKDYIPGKEQFKKNGEPNSNIIKWCAKHGGEVEKREDVYFTNLYGKEYKLPIPQEPIVTHEKSNIEDSTFIKGVLVEMGWKPSAYKERDLTLDTRKQKLSQEKFAETVQRYVEQTLNSPFKLDRCERVSTTPTNLLKKLAGHDLKKPLKVYTNPTFTVGQEKEIDPALEKLYDKFPYVQQIVEYLTYKHRRNSILGGGADIDEWEDDDDATNKGFLANIRADGRIPTPADTCGAATGRMLHRLVVNVPRATSLYGGKMRALFGVSPDEPIVQFAYDFASLEARIEAHFCWRYDEDKIYSNSLLQEKPFDVHTVTSKKVAALIGQDFSRSSAKNVKYASTYGAQAARIAKTVGCDITLGQKIFDAFWEAAQPLADLKERLTAYWKTVGGKKFILGLDKRKINTRSEHALLNSLFQSAGVICAKRVAVLIDRLASEAGLGIDFWKDDYREKSYLQSMICNHDEQQFEISKSLIKWKKFETEDELSAFLRENPEWSATHSERGFFAGTSIANNILIEAVEKTNKLYKLNVPLGTEAMYGRNWCETH